MMNMMTMKCSCCKLLDPQHSSQQQQQHHGRVCNGQELCDPREASPSF